METLLQIGLSNALVATLLALVAVCVGRFCRRPALTHSLWLLVLLKLITPPLVSVPLPWPQSATPTADPAAQRFANLDPLPPSPLVPDADRPVVQVPEGVLAGDFPLPLPEPGGPQERLPQPAELEQPLAVIAEPNAESEGSSSVPWLLIAGVVWLIGSVAWLSVAGVRSVRFCQLLAHAEPAPAALQQEAAQLAARIGLARCPSVWLVAGAVSPMVWSLGRAPRLLLPSGLLERLSDDQRATLLVHELAHLRRRDHWVRWLELIVLSLYWWFPLVWWARREVGEAEEECCDAWVVWALPTAARAYATALVETLDFLSGVPIALPAGASGVGHLNLLRRRLTMILRGTTPRALSGAGLLCVLGLAVLLLPLLPTWAQTPPTGLPGAEGEAGRPGPQGAPSAEQLEKARADLAKKMAELAKARAALAKEQEELEKHARQLEMALSALQMQQDRDTWTKRLAAQRGIAQKPAPPIVKPGWPPELDGRLKDMENKIDLLLRELLQLRDEMRKGRPGGMGPVPPTRRFPDTPPTPDHRIAPGGGPTPLNPIPRSGGTPPREDPTRAPGENPPDPGR